MEKDTISVPATKGGFIDIGYVSSREGGRKAQNALAVLREGNEISVRAYALAASKLEEKGYDIPEENVELVRNATFAIELAQLTEEEKQGIYKREVSVLPLRREMGVCKRALETLANQGERLERVLEQVGSYKAPEKSYEKSTA